jgi:hypothetical protein
MNIFNSYLMGGFECSTHKRHGGRRLDLIAATRHDEFAAADYLRLLDLGVKTVRDGVRWHLIEPEPYRYDFASLEQQATAARRLGIQVIWDLFHYGYPDGIDIFKPQFVDRFAEFSAATAAYLSEQTDGTLFLCPVNEISFFSWIAGEVGGFYPFARKRGNELKRQLVRATIAAIDAIRSEVADVRFVQTDPAIHVTTGKKEAAARRRAESYRRAQFQAFDMLCGRLHPQLGGAKKYLDIIGLNYYFHNQWFYPNRHKILRGHPLYRPLHEILVEYHQRYGRPILLAETGIEDDERADWFRFVCHELRLAKARQVPIQGVCLYPIVNHPGWDDDRYCHNGLWEYPDETGHREIYQPLADELIVQAKLCGAGSPPEPEFYRAGERFTDRAVHYKERAWTTG